MLLDYSRSAPRWTARTCWLKALYSHRARLELARTASLRQGILVLAGISLLAAALSNSHAWVRQCILALLHAGGITPGLKRDLLQHGYAAFVSTLLFVPLYFILLLALVTIAAACVRSLLSRTWSRAFPAISIGCVPLLWFFVLLQLESIAPFAGSAILPAEGAWNPITNSVRFALLLISLVLLVLWITDALRLYTSLSTATAPARSSPTQDLPSSALRA